MPREDEQRRRPPAPDRSPGTREPPRQPDPRGPSSAPEIREPPRAPGGKPVKDPAPRIGE